MVQAAKSVTHEALCRTLSIKELEERLRLNPARSVIPLAFRSSAMDANLISRAMRSNGLRFPEKTRIAETWQQNYEELGDRLWGFSPSPTAKVLAEAILASNICRSERIEIVDWGCGYGRDSLYFLELGFDVIGIDVSSKAIALARAAYKRRQQNGIPLIGSASFHAGDISSVFDSRTGQTVRAFFLQQSIPCPDFVHLLASRMNPATISADLCR